jgi:glycosyltransferase involved in cell wall biosynthesis
VILPVRNGMPFVRDAVASILGQTHTGFELLLIDDGSRDGTRTWADDLQDPRIRVVDSRGRGIVAALNTGLEDARGEFVARQDADDRSQPHRFATQVAFLRARPEVAVVGTWADFVDETDRPVESAWVADVRRLHDAACTPDALRRLLPLTCALVHGSVMARAAVLREAGGYRQEFEWAEDYDLWLRLLPRHAFAKVPERLYVHRLHPQRVSDEHRDLQLRRTIAAKIEYIQRMYPSLARGTAMMVRGAGAGSALYARAAAEAGWTLVDEDAPLCVVTDLRRLDEWRLALAPPQWRWEGNIAIRDL